MKALTLIEPWGWAIAHAGKRFEHRSWHPWPSVVGKEIAIHAGKKFDAAAAERIEQSIPGLMVPRDTPRGIVAIARVAGWVHRYGEYNVPASDLMALVRDSAHTITGTSTTIWSVDMRWYNGGLAWLLDDVIALPHAIPCRGAQGLWDVPCDIEAEIRRVRAGYP